MTDRGIPAVENSDGAAPLTAAGDGAPAAETHQAWHRLLAAVAVIASGTMVSRILGFARAILLAFVLGNGTRQVEMFGTASLIPNTLYMLLAGGALNTVLVPQIVRAVKNDADGGQAFVSRLMTAFLAAITGITAIMTIASPLAVLLWTSSGWRTPALAAQYASLVNLTYLTMPQLFFYGAFFLVGQVLNAKDRFGPMMWAPIANNVIQIGLLAAYLVAWGTRIDTAAAFDPGQVWLLGGGSTIGIAVQTLILIPFLRSTGFHFQLRWDLRGVELGRTFHIAKWMMGYTAVTMIAQTVVWNLATSAVAGGSGAGGNVYQNAYLIWILPHSLLTVSLATAMLPAASRKAAAGDRDGVEQETTRAVDLATTFLMPASLGLLVLAEPIARVAFGHGRGADDAGFVAGTLAAFAVGLIPYTIQYLYLRGFYALEETRVPFWIQVAISTLNAGLAFVFVQLWHDPTTVAARLALSYSASYVLGWWLTHRRLKRVLPSLSGTTISRHLIRVLLASLPGTLLAWLITWGTDRSDSVALQTTGLIVGCLIGLLTFFFVAKRLRIAEAAQFLSVLRRQPPEPVTAGPPPEAAADPEPAPQDELTTGPIAVPAVPLPTDQVPAGQENADPNGRGVFVRVGVAAPAERTTDFAFDSGRIPREQWSLDDPRLPRVAVGDVLVGRYRLDEVLAVRGRALSWRAFDLRLSRPVLVHVLARGDERTLGFLDLARRAATATDSRFLRVLDAGIAPAVDEAEEGPQVGAFVVYEYVTGRSLEKVLSDGPITGVESAWIVRELADALAVVHDRALFHERLNPDTVIVTATGNVKIVGLLVEAGLTPAETDIDPEDLDVYSLGKVLYSCLVARWPGGPRYGLRAAPAVGGRLLTPSQVKAGIARPLDVLCDRILNPVPNNRQTRITTAQGVARALADMLGTTSAARDLERRLRLPLEQIRPSVAIVAAAAPEPDSLTASGPALSDIFRPDEPELAEDSDEQWLLPAETDDPDRIVPFTPVPPPPPKAGQVAGAPAKGSWLAWLRRQITGTRLLLGVLVLVLLGSLIWALTTIELPGSGPAAEGGPTGTAEIAVKSVTDFDPSLDGGSGQENARLASRAIDDNTDTEWLTERYRGNPKLGGLKPGVGLVLDLGSAKPVASLAVSLLGAGTDIQLRVPSDPSVTAMPVRTQADWRVVASADQADGTVVLSPDSPVTTRYLLVYLTSLPSAGGNYYQGGIADLHVRG